MKTDQFSSNVWIALCLVVACDAGSRPVQSTGTSEGAPPREAAPLAAEPSAAEASGAPSPSATRFTFEEDPIGEAPRGFTSARSGQGAPGRWEVIDTDDAPSGRRAVAQLSDDSTSYRFPVEALDRVAAP